MLFLVVLHKTVLQCNLSVGKSPLHSPCVFVYKNARAIIFFGTLHTMNKSSMRGKKVFVGLSGGVDSAVTAALLVRAGAHVTGVFMKGWYPPSMSCTWAADRHDAMSVAARLKIPFRTLDVADAYKKGVIDYLLAEYEAGRTPNPDVMCNREVKFGEFARYARAHGADYLATGHYAQAIQGTLGRGVDTGKDQSYFLWAIPKEVLAWTLFPLGVSHKTHVRVLAKRFNLPVAQKKDSQGVCFLGSVSVEDFLKTCFDTTSGRAVDEQGKEVGTHSGAILHTIGERVALDSLSNGPWYVVGKRMELNELIVSHEYGHQKNPHTDIKLRECNWLADPSGATEMQYRYHGPIISGKILIDGDNVTFIASAPLKEPLASGQSLVAYAGEQCIGGGIII